MAAAPTPVAADCTVNRRSIWPLSTGCRLGVATAMWSAARRARTLPYLNKARKLHLSQTAVRHDPPHFHQVRRPRTEMATRIKVSLPSSYPYKQDLARFAGRALALPP
jgi:hypothetical protein